MSAPAIPSDASKPITIPAIAPPLRLLLVGKGCGSPVATTVTVAAGGLVFNVLDSVVGAAAALDVEDWLVQLLQSGSTLSCCMTVMSTELVCDDRAYVERSQWPIAGYATPEKLRLRIMWEVVPNSIAVSGSTIPKENSQFL